MTIGGAILPWTCTLKVLGGSELCDALLGAKDRCPRPVPITSLFTTSRLNISSCSTFLSASLEELVALEHTVVRTGEYRARSPDFPACRPKKARIWTESPTGTTLRVVPCQP